MSGTPRGAGPGAGHGVRDRHLLLRLGLPRDPSATKHLAGFLVATVSTVLLTRALLAVSGYPQLGGGGLHVAHVLWGGLLLAVAIVLSLSYAGPVVRPVVALVGGVGFGLFVDEIGKFVTSDNDYFYEPTAALIYVVVVGLVLLVEAMHRRSPRHSSEALAGAVDHAVAGVAGGFSPRARRHARGLVADAGDVPAAAEVGALLDRVSDDTEELPDVIGTVAHWIVRGTRHLVRARWVPWVTVGALTLTGAATVGRGIYAWSAGADVPGWVVTGMLVSGLASVLCALRGLVLVRRDREEGYRWFRRAVLLSLLVTQIFLFRIDEWAATVGLLGDLFLLGVVAAELDVITERRLARAAAKAPDTGSDEPARGR
ncbi:hypothetical protein AB6N24_10240 [Cellulomonas sp. 179-A 4D5 NHS]|uniref:hypothetical protein n=1 Tax=Cellulomonas sp. 179-A 4D5 NHS TaxID=3142378 RepID=UPI0039A1C586